MLTRGQTDDAESSRQPGQYIGRVTGVLQAAKRRLFRRNPIAAAFDHAAAQKYEFQHNRQTIQEHFARVYARFEDEKAKGGLWQSANDQWFCGDEALFDAFVAHVRNRKCLEVGSGPFGHIAPCYWLKDRVIIEPLADQYRAAQLAMSGKTFFTDEIKTYTTPAETAISALDGRVDGFIVCRNALDHCEDPMAILANMASYAAPGCYFLLWTDIWHLAGLDDGHRNITRSVYAMDAFLSGLGFDILKRGESIRDPAAYIEYGVIARKR